VANEIIIVAFEPSELMLMKQRLEHRSKGKLLFLTLILKVSLPVLTAYTITHDVKLFPLNLAVEEMFILIMTRFKVETHTRVV
jgi:hypothetical protein